MNIVLVRMLATTLWRNIHHRTLQQFQQTLLHTLSAHVSSNGRIVPLACNLVNLINKHYTTLRSLLVIVGSLQQASKDTLNIFAHIAGLGKHRCIHYSKRNLDKARNSTRKQRLARTGRADHNDVALFNLHISVSTIFLRQALIVIVNSYSQSFLGIVLTDDILVKKSLNLLGFRHVFEVSVKPATTLNVS